MDKYLFLIEIFCIVCLLWPVRSEVHEHVGNMQTKDREVYNNFGNFTTKNRKDDKDNYLKPDTEFNRILSHIHNYAELCGFMSTGDCEKLIEELAFDDQSGDKVAVSGRGPQVAKFDACNPRMQTIAIPRHHDPEIIIWPPCTRAKRCGGCCTSDVFSCEPTETRDKYVKVFDTKLAYPGAQRFMFVGIRNVRIVEHTQCDAQCKTKPHECHKYQTYKHRKCRCECREERLKLRSTCHKNQIWDDSECDCICPNRATMECPPPFRFSTTTCKCTIKTEVTGEIDLNDLVSQFDKNLDLIKQDKFPDAIDFVSLFKLTGGLDGREPFIDNGNAVGDGEEVVVTEEPPEVTTEPTTTTTTTEPTTTTTTTEPPTTTTEKITTTTKKPKSKCEDHKCRGDWMPIDMKNGRCDCRPPVFFKLQALKKMRGGLRHPSRKPGRAPKSRRKLPRRV